MTGIEITMVVVCVAIIAKYIWGLFRFAIFMFTGEDE